MLFSRSVFLLILSVMSFSLALSLRVRSAGDFEDKDDGGEQYEEEFEDVDDDYYDDYDAESDEEYYYEEDYDQEYDNFDEKNVRSL